MSTYHYLRFSFLLSTIAWLTVSNHGYAATYYVAPNGSDSNDGSQARPFRTILYAIEQVASGDQIYLREGVYYPTQTIRIERASGTLEQTTKLWAYPGEEPIIDGSQFTVFDPDASDNDILRLRAAYWHLKGITMRNSPSGGVLLTGDESVGNILEQLTIHDNRDTGLDLYDGVSQTLILNCDSYRNFDPQTNGENADGFGVKSNSTDTFVGSGNVFRGCRAWANSDDGWDFWQAGNAVTVENCWAYNNGFDIWNFGSDFTGNGNGFKLGRDGGAHVLKNCIAWGNRVRGFDANNNTSGVTLYNCTGWNNNRNFVFYGEPEHILRNCLSHKGTEETQDATDDQSNSWNLSVTITDDDFRSLSDAIATGARFFDGSLPISDFLKLADGSDAIDAGIDVGLPFSGAAPDLGAYETDSEAMQTAQGGVGRTEAEAMDLENYEVAARSGTSGAQIIQAISLSQAVSASYRFTGSDGEYDLRIRYLDENDGRTTFTLITNDVTTRQWAADQVTEGPDLWKTEVVEGIFLREDSRIEIQAGPDGGEYARLDYIEVAAPDADEAAFVVRARGATGEEVMALRIDDQEVIHWEVTSDWADYTYEGAVVGNVKIAFVNDKFIRSQIDRNLIVDNIRTADEVREAEAQATNTGAWAGTCGGGSFSETMQCNGHIDFGNVATGGRSVALQSGRKTNEGNLDPFENQILVYPNPTSDGRTTVSIRRSSVPQSLTVVDRLGKIIHNQATGGQRQIDLDLSKLPSGVYFLRMLDKEPTSAWKIIVQ